MQMLAATIVFLLTVGQANGQAASSADTPISPSDFARRVRVFALECQQKPFWDVNQVADLLVKANANTIRYPIIGTDPGPHSYFNSDYLPKWPGLERDLLQDMLDACKRLPCKINIFPYIQMGYLLSPDGYRRFGDWAALDVKGRPLDFNGVGTQTPEKCEKISICLNNPKFIETYAALAREVVQNYPVEGLYFDGPIWNPRALCFCPYCRQAFQQMHGYKLSDTPFSEWQSRYDYTRMRCAAMERTMAAVCKAIKSVRDVPVLYNMSSPLRNPAFHASLTLPCVDGALIGELHRDRAHGGQSGFVNALVNIKTGLAFGKAAWAYCPMGPFYETPHYDYDLTIHDLEVKLLGTMQLAHGATPLIETMRSYLADPTGLQDVRELFELEEKYEKLYFDYRPVPFIGLYFSTRNNLLIGSLDNTRDAIIGRVVNEGFVGDFTILTYAHQQFNVIRDQHITLPELSKYRILFLSNVAYLSGTEIEAIKAYVKNGGSLLATYETSLYDENGRRRSDFGLKELFRVGYQGSKEKKLTVIKESPDANYNSDKFDRQLCVGQSFVKPADVSAGIYGKGRVVYIALPTGNLYYDHGYPVRQFLNNAIEWLASEDIPVRINGIPDCVITNLTEKGTARALHLINYAGNNYENPLNRITWVAPLDGIEVVLRNPPTRELTEARLLTNDQRLPVVNCGSHAVVRIPRLNEYECLLLTYTSAADK